MDRRSTRAGASGVCLAGILLAAGCTPGPVAGARCGPGTVLDGGVCLPAGGGGADGGGAVADGGTAGGCRSTADCGDGGVCVLGTRTCAAPAGRMCGMPATGTGTYPVGTRCQGTGDCAPGLTCVPGTVMGLDGSTGSYVPVDGTCLLACDPCHPECGPADGCLALGGGEPGGFCQLGPLRSAGEPCFAGVCASGTCVGGIAPRCSGPLCVPETDGGVPNAFGRAYHSADCGPGEVCILREASTAGSIFDCEPGKIVGVGQFCGPAGPRWCGAGPCSPVMSVCYPACTGTGPCGSGGTCASGACVPDGSMGRGDPCLATANCASGLTCKGNRCR